jgi:hypothetical protein
MTDTREALVHEADLRLGDETDPAAPGAAVTTALCGHWEHEGPCRWPHNNSLEVSDTVATFRTLFVAPATEEAQVRELIERALREATGWAVLRTRPRPISPEEQPLAARLAATPSL